MGKVKTILILLEVVIGFGWLVYFWLVSLMVSPLFVAQLFNDGKWVAAMSLLAMAFGGAGVWGVLQLTLKVVNPDTKVMQAQRLRVFIGLGFIALAMATALLSELSWLLLIFLVPALVVLHFLYLARGYFRSYAK